MAASFSETIAGQTMNLDLSKVIAAEKRKLDGLCTDLFLIVIRMRESEDLGAPAALAKLIRFYINLFDKNCTVIGMPQEDIAVAKYAIVALLDETVLSIAGPCRDHWISSPLQLELFGDNIAGEEFYRKLDKLLVEPEKMREVLEVYYLCLSLGFEGKYKIGNKQERDRIIDNVGRTLQRTLKARSPGLSPHGRRILAALSTRRGGRLIPLWMVAAVAVGAVAVLWAALYFISQSYLQQALESL
jgi:type VI secretion system protein ImpK